MTAHRKVTADMLVEELGFTTSRSGGPGGQNVNKVNSKVTLHFDVRNSRTLTPEEKELIIQKASSRITGEGVIVLTSQESRSQRKNKEVVLAKFDDLLSKAFRKKKTRKPTRPSGTAVQERLKKKRTHSEKKKWRQKPDL